MFKRIARLPCVRPDGRATVFVAQIFLEIEMSITHQQTAAAFPVTLFARAVKAVAGTFRRFSNWRDFRRLHEMSDHELADIGLERSDLFDAMDRRVSLDPTRYLDSLVRSRGGLRSPRHRDEH